jgi:hypothetical protein
MGFGEVQALWLNTQGGHAFLRVVGEGDAPAQASSYLVNLPGLDPQVQDAEVGVPGPCRARGASA